MIRQINHYHTYSFATRQKYLQAALPNQTKENSTCNCFTSLTLSILASLLLENTVIGGQKVLKRGCYEAIGKVVL